MRNNTPTTAAIYTRISLDQRGEREAVARQLEECQKLAEQQGLIVAGMFTDEDISAYSGRRRPGFEAMLAGLKDHKFDAIICWHTDRLYRRLKDFERLAEAAGGNPVPIFQVAGPAVDLSSASGVMTAQILGAVAQQESAHKGERQRLAFRQGAEKGRFGGGPRPFGYESDGVTVRDDEAAEFRKLADAVLSGQSLRALAVELRQRGVPGALGQIRWTASGLRRTLSNPRYAGLRSYRGEVLGKAVWPAIISVETHETLLAVLEHRSRIDGGRRGPVPKGLGTNLYVCAVCGQPTMHRTGAKKSRSQYVCRRVKTGHGEVRRHPAKDAALLDEYVESRLLDCLKQTDVVQAMCAVIESDDIDTAGLQAELKRIQRQILQLRAKVDAGDITDEDFAAAISRRRRRGNEIQQILATQVQKSPLTPLLGADSVQKIWDENLTIGQKRDILAEVLTVTLYPSSSGRRLGGLDKTAINIELNPIALSAVQQSGQEMSWHSEEFTPPTPAPLPRQFYDGKTSPFSDEEREQIRQRYTAGESQNSIADEFGVSRQAVLRVVRGIARSGQRTGVHRNKLGSIGALSDEQIDRMQELLAVGQSIAAIAATFDVNRSVIYKSMRKRGIPVPHPDHRENRLSAEQIQQIQQMYVAGESRTAIARAVDVGYDVVAYWIRKANGPISSRKLLSDEQADQVRQMCEAGETRQAIANKFGVSVATIGNALREAHWITDQRDRREQRDQQIIQMRADGETVSAIADTLGIAIGTVYKVMHKHGVPIRSLGRRR